MQREERQIESTDLIEMEIDNDLKLNGNGLSVQFSWIALPFLQNLSGFVIQTIAEAAFHLLNVDGAVFLDDRVQNDRALDMRLACVVGIIGFRPNGAGRSRSSSKSADFIDASANAASTTRACPSSVTCTYAMACTCANTAA
jgi:hypothetical protein